MARGDAAKRLHTTPFTKTPLHTTPNGSTRESGPTVSQIPSIANTSPYPSGPRVGHSTRARSMGSGHPAARSTTQPCGCSSRAIQSAAAHRGTRQVATTS